MHAMEDGILPQEGVDGSDHTGLFWLTAEGVELSLAHTFSLRLCWGWLAGFLAPQPGSNPCPTALECRGSTTGPPRSPHIFVFNAPTPEHLGGRILLRIPTPCTRLEALGTEEFLDSSVLGSSQSLCMWVGAWHMPGGNELHCISMCQTEPCFQPQVHTARKRGRRTWLWTCHSPQSLPLPTWGR